MPTGPKGQKRPADAVGLAVMVAKIATGEVTDAPEDDGKDKAPTKAKRSPASLGSAQPLAARPRR